MKISILIDAYGLFDQQYYLINSLALKLSQKMDYKVTLACDSQSEREILKNSKEWLESDICLYSEITDNELKKYKYFISVTRDIPQKIKEIQKIVSIALLIDLKERATSIEKSIATITENCRFWRDYDLCYAFIDYYRDCELSALIDRQINIIGENCSGGMDESIQKEELKIRSQEISDENCCNFINELEKIQHRREKKPLVSIVTITFNLLKNGRDKSIKECIKSVQNQTYKNIEHIIIDGASDDGTLELLEPYLKNDNIKIYSEKDSGVYDAMNKGLKHANGKYIVYMNSDDCYCDNDAVRDAVELLEIHQADYLFGDAQALTVEGQKTVWVADINKLPYAMNYCHQTAIVRTDVMNRLGGFNLKYKVSSDSDIMIRLYEGKYKYCVLRRPMVLYRLGGLSSVQSKVSNTDHAEAFYNHIGNKIGLTRMECQYIWAMQFLSLYPKLHVVEILRKLGTVFNVDDMYMKIICESSTELSLKGTIRRLLQIIWRKAKCVCIHIK